MERSYNVYKNTFAACRFAFRNFLLFECLYVTNRRESCRADIIARGYVIDKVDVAVGENSYVKSGPFKQKPVLVGQLKNQVKQDLLLQVAAIRNGDKPATLHVDLTRIVVANATSRSLLGADTLLIGDVTVIDGAGNVIAFVKQVEFSEAGMKNQSMFNGIPIGVLISTISNSTGGSDADRLGRLSQGFTAKVGAWLLN